jgi:hypothetical protein
MLTAYHKTADSEQWVGKREEERGKRKEERGKRKEERGKLTTVQYVFDLI